MYETAAHTATTRAHLSNVIGMGKNLPELVWRRVVVLAVLILASACDRADAKRGRTRGDVANDIAVDSMGVVPQQLRVVAFNGPRELVENSAAAMSGTQPGVLFSINDSGNDALLFAVDTLGADRGVWRVTNAKNVDWESASLGPCGESEAQARCVYIGDAGDNTSRHPTRTIYRLAEPTASGKRSRVRAEALVYRYVDGPHDVEAMYVSANGDMLLITKRPLFDARRRLRPALVFRLPRSAWNSAAIAVAQLVDSLPVVPGSAPLRLITDASLAPDGRHLAVRTYTQVYIFATDAASGAVNHAVAASVCNVTSLGEPQGEGVTWADSRGRLVFTSEGVNQPLRLATCPVPK